MLKISVLMFLFLLFAGSAAAASGDLDATFNGSGLKTTDFPDSTYGEATDVLVQPDGKIVVSVTKNGFEGFDMALVRYNSDGSLDQGFGTGGIVATPFAGEFDMARALARQTDGKILVAGSVGLAPARFAVVRYHANGTLDTTFDGDGIATAAVGQNASAQALAVQADGKIVVGGNASDTSTGDFFAVVRFHAGGAPDTNFGAGGIVSASFGVVDFLNDLLIQPDGKILAAGTGEAGAESPILAMIRLNPNGTFDASFDGDGRVAAQFPGFEEATAVELQTDGKIIVGGQFGGSFALFRLSANGALDPAFGSGGVASADFGSFSSVSDLKIQPDGKIVAGGSAYAESLDFAVARFDSDGAPDKSFGANGKVTTAVSGDDDALNSLALQPDGKIVGAGISGFAGDKKATVVRYLGNSAAPANTAFDFDGDGRADLAVFRPAGGNWYLSQSTGGFAAVNFGLAGDISTPADFDGDGRTDIAVFRDGFWYLQQTSSGFSSVYFGQAGDVPVPADFDGDGRADFAVFRPSDGAWYRLNSSDDQFVAVRFGQAGDKPVTGDFDGDSRADQAVFRDGNWYLNRSTAGFAALNFGLATDKLVPADYDGDGRADIAVFRDGNWYRINSSNDEFVAINFGISTDLPVAADYDGDGRADIAVFRDGVWYLQQSTGGFSAAAFGQAGDRPVPNVFVR